MVVRELQTAERHHTSSERHHPSSASCSRPVHCHVREGPAPNPLLAHSSLHHSLHHRILRAEPHLSSRDNRHARWSCPYNLTPFRQSKRSHLQHSEIAGAGTKRPTFPPKCPGHGSCRSFPCAYTYNARGPDPLRLPSLFRPR